MKERLGEFYRSHIKDKVTKTKTILGHTTAENIARQLEESKPVDIDALLGQDFKDIKPSEIDERGEIKNGDKE